MKLAINSRWLNGTRARITVQSNGSENTVRIIGLWGRAGTASHARVRDSLQSLTSPPEGHFTLKVRGQTEHDLGAHLDLPFALAVLAAAHRFSRFVAEYWEFYGQLKRGKLEANKQDFSHAVRTAVALGRQCVLPASDVARLPSELAAHCVGAETIEDVVTHLRGLEPARIPRRSAVKLEHRA